MTLEHSQQLADEKLLEAILTDNRARIGDNTMTVGEETAHPAPDVIDGLITAPLLASASEAQRCVEADESTVERLVSYIHPRKFHLEFLNNLSLDKTSNFFILLKVK